MPQRTLVIGDVHGHYDRLFDLLAQEDIIDEHGARVDHETVVVQLGDLGHFGGATGSPIGDQLCWQEAWTWLDVVLWGNHDRALISQRHAFHGFQRPNQVTLDAVARMDEAGRIRLAYAAHGFLVTHAGLHAAAQKLADSCDRDAERIAARLNVYDLEAQRGEHVQVVDNISFLRSGRASWGGVLWCDWNEKRVRGVRQIVGHTIRSRDQRVRCDNFGSYNIDVGSAHNGQLAGLWLPDRRVVEVRRPDWGPASAP